VLTRGRIALCIGSGFDTRRLQQAALERGRVHLGNRWRRFSLQGARWD